MKLTGFMLAGVCILSQFEEILGSPVAIHMNLLESWRSNKFIWTGSAVTVAVLKNNGSWVCITLDRPRVPST